jgi:hypothetical protein
MHSRLPFHAFKRHSFSGQHSINAERISIQVRYFSVLLQGLKVTGKLGIFPDDLQLRSAYECPYLSLILGPSGLRHELFSPAPTVRSWVRIPLRHGCLCVFCMRFFCFYIVSSETASRPNKRLMRTYHWISLFMSYKVSK